MAAPRVNTSAYTYRNNRAAMLRSIAAFKVSLASGTTTPEKAAYGIKAYQEMLASLRASYYYYKAHNEAAMAKVVASQAKQRAEYAAKNS